MLSSYDAEAPLAIRRLITQGAQLRPLPPDALQELEAAARAHYAEISAQNTNFKKVFDHFSAFATNHYAWWPAGDYAADTLGIRYYRRG